MECPVCHTALPDSVAFCHACGKRQHGAEEPDVYEYAAFISYRHLPRDQAVALKVQKAIEAFRLPRNLEASTVTGTKSLGKCFRDEDELPAAHSLPDRITDALAKSRALVVVCSLDTPGSPWIQREVETYAQLHGRERIFAVLADGTSSESVPDLVKRRIARDAHDSLVTVPAEPLAADMRPAAAANEHAETLRIIAAVAGCGFDDLRQRERSRKRRRIVGIVTIAVAIALVVGSLAFATRTSRQDALMAESLRLAAESQQLLERGDRYGAIETALAALPSSSTDASRPLCPEAQRALEDALQVHPDDSAYWLADYSLQTAHSVSALDNGMLHETDSDSVLASAIAIDQQCGILAVSDDAGTVSTYDVRTGRALAECTMPDSAGPLEGGLYVRTLAAANGRLVVSNSGKPGAIICFDESSGSPLWSYDGSSAPVMSLSNGGDYVDMATPLASGGISAAAAEMSSGAVVAARNHVETDIPPPANGMCSAIGSYLSEFYVAIGDKLLAFDLADDPEEPPSATLELPIVTALAACGDTIVAASADPIPENGFERRFCIQAFDASLNALWRQEGTFMSQMLVNGNLTGLLEGAPSIAGAGMEGPLVAVTAGRQILVLDLNAGDVALQREMSQTIVYAQVLGQNDLLVACSDGSIEIRSLTGAESDLDGDSTRLQLPFPIRWARACMLDDRLVVLAIPADEMNRIVAFHANLSGVEQPENDLGFDELVAHARETLAQAGR